MKKQLFPKEFINVSLEHYIFLINRKTNAIYILIVVFLIAAIVSLPFISIDVTKKATGVITTQEQRFQLITPVGGIVSSQNVIENKLVKTGDPIVHFDASRINKEIDQTNKRINQLESFIADLNHLINGSYVQIFTERYKVVLLQYQSNWVKQSLEKQRMEKIYLRQKELFLNNVIAEADYDRDEANFLQASAELKLFEKQSINNWKGVSIELTEEINQLKLQILRLEEERERFTLNAPGRGELQNIVPIRAGQFIAAGTKIAEISPDSALIAVCYVVPKDIGLLHVGMQGVFRIEAFNSNEWGFVQGKISTISSDAYFLNEKPFFKVECQRKEHYLSLTNGFVGKFKKGMTLQANFKVTKRTLYQLLHDKIDDWINPAT